MPLTLTAIDVGSSPGDNNGTPGRTAFQTINTNFALVAGAMEDAELKAFVVGCTGKDVDLAVGDSVEWFDMPYSFVLLDARAHMFVAPTGADVVLDIREGASSVLESSGLIIPAGTTSSESTAGNPVSPHIILNEGNRIHIDVNQVGSTVAGQWLKVTLIGYVIWTSW